MAEYYRVNKIDWSMAVWRFVACAAVVAAECPYFDFDIDPRDTCDTD